MNPLIFLRLEPRNIDKLTRIIEACSHLGVVSTLDRREGLVVVRGTPDTVPELEKILSQMPFEVERYEAE